MSEHLDAARWRALQTHADPALLAHLESGCEVCDAFLSSLPGPDGAVDALLLGVAPPPVVRDELAWARLQRRRRGPSLGWAVAAGLVLSLGSVALAAQWGLTQPASSTGLKGAVRGEVELRLARRAENGLVEVLPSASLPPSTQLVFQAHSRVQGPARLFLQRGDAEPVELAQLGLHAGVQTLERDGDGLLGLALTGERGRLVLWLVAAERPFGAEEALEAIHGLGTGALSVGRHEVLVQP